jgi:CBS domain containing-hemolysin-like protein
MTVLIVLILVTIGISANCSFYEAILYSARTATLEVERTAGTRPRLAERMIALKKNISVPIASILIMNTLANTGGAMLIGMHASEAIRPESIPIFSAFMTLLILFFGEIAPKTLAVLYWRKAWIFTVWPLTVMNRALYPLVFLTKKFSDLLMRGNTPPSVTEDEILAFVRMGASEGQITQRESRLVHNIIALENRRIKEVMTPRTVMFALDAGTTVADAVKAIDRKGFTRIPIYEEDREEIVGYITVHDLFSAKAYSDQQVPIRSIVKPISFVPETRDALAMLTTALTHREHIFVVVDEYGGVSGLITLEDLIETLLGAEIVDETDREVDLREMARRRRVQRPSS